MNSPACSAADPTSRSEEHTSELQSQSNLVCRLLLEKKSHLRIHHTRLAPISERLRAPPGREFLQAPTKRARHSPNHLHLCHLWHSLPCSTAAHQAS